MIRSFIICLFLSTFSTPSIALANHHEAHSFGAALSKMQIVTVSELLANPAKYSGKKVKIKGEILDVCPMAGCWVDVGSDVDNQRIKFKVTDGEIVFPVDAKGKHLIGEGTFVVTQLSQEETTKREQHLAEEKGREFNPRSVTGPTTLYMIKGTGATVQ